MKKNVLFCLVFLASFTMAMYAAQTVYTVDEIKTKITNKENVKELLVKGKITTYKINNTTTTAFKIGDFLIWNAKDIPNKMRWKREGVEVTLEIIDLDFYEEGSQEHTFYQTQYVGNFKLPEENPEDLGVIEGCNRYYESAVKFMVDTPVVFPFTINSTGARVIFSSGNLQYCPARDEWRFALRQFDRVAHGKSRYAPEGLQASGMAGNATTVFYDSIDNTTTDPTTPSGFKEIKNVPCNNLLASKTYRGWIDLFPWGTSTQGHQVNDKGAAFVYPYNCNQSNLNNPYNTYGFGPSYGGEKSEGVFNNNFDKQSGMNRYFDWGYANFIREYSAATFDDNNHVIELGKRTMYHKGIWRTLTAEEWDYILTKRFVSGNDSPFTNVRLQYGTNAQDTVTGILIFPDDFSFAESGIANIPFGARPITPITRGQWDELEAAGVVFLPCQRAMYVNAQNERTVSEAGMGIWTRYWTATAADAAKAYYQNFEPGGGGKTGPLTDNRYGNYQVRLVQDLYDPCDAIKIEYRDTIAMPCEGNSFTWDLGYKTRNVSLTGNNTQEHFYDTLRTNIGCDSIISHLDLRKRTWETETEDSTVTLCANETDFTWDMGYKKRTFVLPKEDMTGYFEDTLRSTLGGCDSIIKRLTLNRITWALKKQDTVVMLCEGTNFTWDMGYKTHTFRLTLNASQKDFYDTLRSTIGGCDSIISHLDLRKKLWQLETKDTAVVLCESDGRTFTWVKGNESEDVSIPASETQKDFYDTIKSELGGCDSIAYHLNLRAMYTEWKHDTTIAQLNSTFQWKLPHKTKPCQMTQDKMDFYDTLRSQVNKDCDSIYYHLHLRIPGFSVSADTRVTFAPGNLQYQASTDTWRFAPTQYHRCLRDNENISKTYSGWIDLFGRDSYEPYQSSKKDSYIWREWGDKEIYEGTTKHEKDTWRTPGYFEIRHLVVERRFEDHGMYSFVFLRYGNGSRDTVSGVIFYPDYFSFEKAGITPIPFDDPQKTYLASYDQRSPSILTNINASTWNALEQAGCVFIPCVYWRKEKKVQFGVNSYYWTKEATRELKDFNKSLDAYMRENFFSHWVLYFNVPQNKLFCTPSPTGGWEYEGHAVRLIKNLDD